MFEIDRITKEDIAKCLKKDKLLRTSLGVKMQFTTLKWTGILLLGWTFILLVTPLPENLLMNRVAMTLLFFALTISWAVDYVNFIGSMDEAATSLTNILKKDSQLRIITDGENTVLKHKKFEAQCSQITQLRLKELLDTEIEIQEAVSELIAGKSLFHSRNLGKEEKQGTASKKQTKA